MLCAKAIVQSSMQANFESRSLKYLPPLTGVRALAALLVLGLHTEQNVPIDIYSFLPFFSRGYLGVDFFFILSGFIITHVYLTSLAHPEPTHIRIFLWHRFIRLYPVHITVLVGLVGIIYVAGAAGFVLNNPKDWEWKDLVWNFLLLQAWGVTEGTGWNAPSWSISAEWFAYILFPLLAPALTKVHERLIALLIAGAALATVAVIFAMADWTINTWTGPPVLIRVCGEFLCGAALCRAVDHRNQRPPFEGDILGSAAFISFLVGASMAVPDFYLVALLALTILGVATSQRYLAKILGGRSIIWLGEISYSIYMVHFPVLLVMRRFWERLGFAGWSWSGKAFAFAITVALVIALAATLFYGVERPARTRLRNQVGVLAKA
jgi:peptidoglycan/LPS O-acetylase OafA/YrhL